MSESFGGAFMIKLMLIFIIIYITFMGVAVEYAKVFRIKNQVINMLEQSQFSINDTKFLEEVIDPYLSGVPYNNYSDSLKKECERSLSDSNIKSKFTNNGVCIEAFENKDDDDSKVISAHFKVTVYIHIVFPFFGLNMTMPISGETKTIHYY